VRRVDSVELPVPTSTSPLTLRSQSTIREDRCRAAWCEVDAGLLADRVEVHLDQGLPPGMTFASTGRFM
jgi:hypothetical protein